MPIMMKRLEKMMIEDSGGQIEDQRLSALLVKWIHDGELFPAGLNQTKPSSSTVGVSPGNKKYIVSRFA